MSRWSTASGKLSKGLPQYHRCFSCHVVTGSTSMPSCKASSRICLLSSMTTEHPRYLAHAAFPQGPQRSLMHLTEAHLMGRLLAQSSTSWARFCPQKLMRWISHCSAWRSQILLMCLPGTTSFHPSLI